jgi:Putative DNA-binding domain
MTMTKDFFFAALDSISYTEIEEFLGISSPVETRPSEGTLLEYKSADSGDWVEVVASFANTAGGLIFLGVESDRNKNNVPIAAPGISFFGGDIKARLASKIISQVTPRPDFDMVAAPIEDDPTKFVVVIRVREGTYPPYQYAKERDKISFPIRVHDRSGQANLRDLEYLFNKRGTFAETTEARLQDFFNQSLFPELLKEFAGPGDIMGHNPKPYHVWSVRPRVPLRLRLDRSFDRTSQELVKRLFPDVGYGQFWPSAMTGGSHILRWQASVDVQNGPPVRWARMFEWKSSGDIRFSERIDRRVWNGGESVSDLYISGLRFLKLIAEFYRNQNSFGSLSVLHSVHLEPEFILLQTFPDQDGIYRETNAIAFSPMRPMGRPGTSNATTEIGNLARDSHVELVCDFMLTHLRQLREATVDYEEVKKLVAGCPIDKPLVFT